MLWLVLEILFLILNSLVQPSFKGMCLVFSQLEMPPFVGTHWRPAPLSEQNLKRSGFREAGGRLGREWEERVERNLQSACKIIK